MTAPEKLHGQEERPKPIHRPYALPPFNDSRTQLRRSAFPYIFVSKKVVLLLLLLATVEAFSFVSSHDSRNFAPSSRARRLVVVPQETKASVRLRMQQAERSDSQVPRFVSILNSSTKWLVTLGNVVALWSRPRNVFGPFIVTGVILATYLTALLKRLIDQGRPDGAPFSDPGMPSSHALSSFFLANCWRQTYQHGPVVGPWLWSAAATVALLRVVCGFHTLAQISVGAVLGVSLGHGWMMVGRWLSTTYPVWTFRVVWLAYVSLSLLFLQSTMSKWTQEDRHL